MFLLSTLLDPRFRLLLNPAQVNAAKSQLLQQLKDVNGGSTGSSSSSCTASPSRESDEPPKKRFCHLSKVLEQKFKEDLKRAATAPPGEQELEQYLHSVHPIEEHFDPLYFWVEEEKNYPLLSLIALDILVIPASSAPVERAFSTAGESTSGKRNRLASKNLEREILLRKNREYLYA